jgi:hypothetical protein
MDSPIVKLPSGGSGFPSDLAAVPRSGHGPDRDLGASLDQVLAVQNTPIPGAETASEEAAYRRRLIAHIRTQDALLWNVSVKGSVEGLVAGGLFQLGWGLMFPKGGR